MESDKEKGLSVLSFKEAVKANLFEKIADLSHDQLLALASQSNINKRDLRAFAAGQKKPSHNQKNKILRGADVLVFPAAAASPAP